VATFDAGQSGARCCETRRYDFAGRIEFGSTFANGRLLQREGHAILAGQILRRNHQGVFMRNVIFLSVLSLSLAAHAEVKVDQPWVRGTVPAQKSTGAFMTLSSDKPVSLIGISSPAAKLVEMHEMKMDKDMMSMQAVEKIDIVPGKPTALKPGGYHLMLINLVKPLNAGESVPLTLEFKTADGKITKQEVRASVRSLAARMDEHGKGNSPQ
jgi:periplasmic copper chaperone A